MGIVTEIVGCITRTDGVESDPSLVSVGLLVGNQGTFSGGTCGNQFVRVRRSPLVFAVIVAQLVTQPLSLGGCASR